MPQNQKQEPKPASAAIHLKFQEGVALHQQGKLADAERIYNQVLRQQPNHFDALHLLGVIALQTRHAEQGADFIRKAIELDANVAAAHCNLGKALLDLKRAEAALASFGEAIALEPNFAMAHNNRGTALLDLTRPDEALANFDTAIALSPDFTEAHSNRGVALERLMRFEEAVTSCDRAIALMPDFAEAHNNRGIALRGLMRHEEALASYDKAIALMPDFVEAHCNRGDALNALKRHEEAARAYAEVLKLDPLHPFTKGMFLYQKLLSCDWGKLDELIAEIERDLAAGKPAATPFGWQGAATSQRSLQRCAEMYCRANFPANFKSLSRRPMAHHDKIRIGYSSGELREQATSHLMVGVFELHDNSRFEIFGVDNGWDDKSAIRKRIDASVHDIIDISTLSDAAAVAAIAKNEIDILVNLNGYFGKRRPQVFAQRAAPIQVNYLGFPGTLGASYIDYIIADQLVVPPNHREFYSEKIVYLPNCYQANDRRKEIGTRFFCRAECALPQNGFVFCCFNNSYKITPSVFERWMRLLKQVPGSVLWLLEDTSSAAANLRKEAAARGVNAERLVFAKRIPLPDHLARHRLADLFLDTLPYNAHTTASDALWTGLPVLTQIGETFAGRVAASLLTTIGLPELITLTPQAYEALAIELANDPQKLAAIKHKLSKNRLTTPLFDTRLITRHLEAAYTAIYERYHAGIPPDHIYVSQ